MLFTFFLYFGVQSWFDCCVLFCFLTFGLFVSNHCWSVPSALFFRAIVLHLFNEYICWCVIYKWCKFFLCAVLYDIIVYMRNRSGSSTDPWGTPQVMILVILKGFIVFHWRLVNLLYFGGPRYLLLCLGRGRCLLWVVFFSIWFFMYSVISITAVVVDFFMWFPYWSGFNLYCFCLFF